MKRADERHEQESLSIARQLLTQAGYSKSEIELVVDDAIKNHSCHDGVVPLSLEGKVLSTADSLAHLKTDFYIFATRALGE